MIQITNSVKLVIAGLSFVVVAACLPAQASAQNLEGYLRRADIDNDGKIEPHEMTGPIRRYMKSKGYSTEERHRIKDVLKQAAESKQAEPAPVTTSDLKVPKFGVEATEKVNVDSFGPATVEEKFSEDVTQKARELLENYDRNKNGILDAPEISQMRWGNPRPSVNDTNGDGRLSFQEIQGRYRDREVAKQRSDASSRDSGRRENDGGGRTSGRDGRGRYGRSEDGSRSGWGASRNSRNSNDSSSRDSDSNSSRSNNSPSTEDMEQRRREQAEKYTESYFASRDLDKNDLLEGDELKKVNSSSKAKYDKNRDGKITKEEVLLATLPPVKTSRSTTSKSTSSRNSSSRYSRSRTSSKGSSAFTKVDSDGDRLVQMHEFSEKWTEKKLKEFNAKDANGDGVISPEEW